MKKLLPIIIGLILILSMVCVVDAAAEGQLIIPDENGDPNQESVTTSVTFSVAHDYKITIPDSITLGKDTGSGSGHISVDIDRIPAGNYINVVLKDPKEGEEDAYYNTTGNFWEMKYSGTYIPFYVGVSGAGDFQNQQHINPAAGQSPLIPGEGVFSVPAEVKSSVEATIHCRIPGYTSDTGSYAGNYEGKLKFEVSITTDAKATTTGVLVDVDGTFETSKGLGY